MNCAGEGGRVDEQYDGVGARGDRSEFIIVPLQ